MAQGLSRQVKRIIECCGHGFFEKDRLTACLYLIKDSAMREIGRADQNGIHVWVVR